jgi:hypothetical protein
MKKTIKEIKIASILLLLSFLGLAAYSQYLISDLSIGANSNHFDAGKIEKFIKTTENTDKLRNVSLLLLESKIEYSNHLNELFGNIRNFALAISVFPASLVFYVFRLNKQFLTSKSTPTKNP